jgi:poly-gamma-glutamate capsule biosynthesis protein CapA/YwtB (metallophosphatase superfamily)
MLLFAFSNTILNTNINAIEVIEKLEYSLSQPNLEKYSIVTKTGKRYRWKDTTKVLLAGDTMFNWMVREKIQNKGIYVPFEEWFPIFDSVDLRFLNLETPILSKEVVGAKEKSFVFFAEKEDILLLKKLKINGVFLGNNHTMDFEVEGLKNTIELLDQNSIQSFGAGSDEAKAYEPRSFSYKDTNIQFYSVSELGHKEHFAKGSNAGIAYFYESKLKSLLKKNKSKSIEQNTLLSIHWGWEYNPEPTLGQRKSAKKMIDSGFDLLVGHHPHVPQGIEIYKGKPIIYSLGNFIFGSKNSYLNHNIVVILHYKANKLAVIELIPVYGKFQQNDYDYHPLDPNPSDDFLLEYAVLCKKLGTDLVVKGGRGYVFLDKTMMRSE